MTTENTHKVPNVPPLRFPEFSGEWEKCTLGEIMLYSTDRVLANTLSNENYISTENMLSDFCGICKANNVPSTGNVIVYQKGDILLSNIRPYLKKVWMANNCGGCSADVFVMKADNDKCISDFLYYLVANDNFINYVMSGAKGIKMPRGDKAQIKKYQLSIPSKSEQYKITELLNKLDVRIRTQNKIIQHLESLITGITQSVRNNATQKVLLRDVLTEKDEKNIGNHDVYSVSVSEGVINQIDYLGRSFAAKETRNYNVVQYGDIVYTKSPTGSFPYGIVKQSYIKEKAAVSPLYGVYKPVSFEVGYYLHHYFTSPIYTTNYLHKLIQKGAKNTINITNQRFLENYIPLSSPEVLEKYVALVSAVTTKLENEKQILSKLKEQKNYLLSKMFI